MWGRHDRILGPDPKADIKAELRFHMECKTEDLIAHGWPPQAARTEAERQFGNILAVELAGERIGEHMKRRRPLREYYPESVQDARYMLRNHAFRRFRNTYLRNHTECPKVSRSFGWATPVKA
jgi:putative ABC transport system permease protein